MSGLARALLAELEPDDLRHLAEALKPYLGNDQGGWLDAKQAAAYAGCTVPALRHAMARGEVEFQQHVDGGKVWLTRAALDRWRKC